MTPTRLRLALAAGIAAPPVAWTLSLVAALGWPGYDPIAQSISLLADGPFGWVQTTSFVVSGVLGAAFALGLPAVLGTTARDRRLVRGLLLLQAALALGFALFPTDPGERGTTLVGRLHLLDFALYALTMPVAIVALGRVMRRDARWRALVRPTFAVGAIVVASAALVPATYDGPLLPWLGLLERLYVAIPSAWQVAVGVTAWRLAARAEAQNQV